MNSLQTYDYFDAHTHFVPRSCSKTFAVRSFRAGIETPNTEYYTIGVHPYDALNDTTNHNMADFNTNDGMILAIGEIGLDFRFTETLRLQIKVFEQQLEFAITHSLPVVIHCVKAYPQTLRLLEKHGCKRFMFHGFDSSLTNAQKIINAGGYISFGAKLLKYNLLQKVFQTITTIAPSHILLESDEAQGTLPQLYEMGAKLSKSNDPHEFNKLIKHNFKTFYNL